jgi:FkbM family methyltransferase
VNFEPYIRRKQLEGLSFDFWIGDEAGRDWYDIGSVDGAWPEMGFIRDRLVFPGAVVFECGAHHGCTTIALSNWVGPQGSVVAFEPSPANAGIARRNIALNELANTTLHEQAIGASDGTVWLSTRSNASVVAGGGDAVQVEMVRLDRYATLRPSLLKIDVEGLEADVLRGAQETMRTTPALAIELHPGAVVRYGSSVEQLIATLDERAYALWMQWDDDEAPVPYTRGEPVTKRAHLFAIPVR